MEDDFTIKNVFRHWLQAWPVTIIILLIGAVVGVAQALTLDNGVKIEEKILIQNKSSFNASADDYLAIINNYIMPEGPENNANCESTFKATGNVLTLTTICPKTNDETITQSELLRTFVINGLNEIYDGAINGVVLSSSAPQDVVSSTDYLKKFLVPFIAAVATSVLIAVFKLDKTLKSVKK